MHLSHVGANTGRDHFSGWSLDWINLGLSYLPYLRRFYAPADARAAFLAVTDAAAGMGGHIVAVPRDSVPVLTRQDTTDPLWTGADAWTPVTAYRRYERSEVAVLALGAPTFIAGAAAEQAAVERRPADVYVVNGFPLAPGFVTGLAQRYHRIITVEDGLIGNVESGLRGFAAYVATHLHGSAVELAHIGISDPQIAPSDDYRRVWEHFGITKEAVLGAIL